MSNQPQQLLVGDYVRFTKNTLAEDGNGDIDTIPANTIGWIDAYTAGNDIWVMVGGKTRWLVSRSNLQRVNYSGIDMLKSVLPIWE